MGQARDAGGVGGGSGPLSYQWFQNGTAVAGATNAVLEFAAVQISDGGLYSVVVSNPWGIATNSWVTATNLTLSQPVELWVDQSVDVHSATNAKRYYRVTGQ